MTVRTPRRRRTALYLVALLCCSGAVTAAAPAGAAPLPEPRVAAAAAATTFSDDFNGPAGSAVDGSKWQTETGDNVNNHERQYYTAGNSNAALDGQGNLVITARKDNPGNYQCWYGRCEYTSARLNTAASSPRRTGTSRRG